MEVWWLQTQAPAAGSRIRIPERVIFCLSCCHKIGDLEVMGEGEGIKQCANGLGWNCENEENVRPEGNKVYALLNAERIVYISFVIKTLIFFLKSF